MGTPAYYYSSTAGTYTIVGALTTSATSVQLNGVIGLPSAPFKIVLDPGQTSEEIVKVTAIAGTTLTVTRAWDGTTASAHSAGAVARHMMTAEDFTLSRSHEIASAAHGTVGAVVGTSDAQALTNKDLTGAGNVFPTSLVTLAGAQALTNKDLTGAGNTFPTSLATLTGTQTLTNKTVTGGTVNPTTLQKSGINVASISEAATLTNKTLSGSSNTFSNIPQTAVTGLTQIQSDVNALKADSGHLASGATAASGWTITGVDITKVGRLCSIYISMDYNGSTINAGSSGDIPNQVIGNVTSNTYWPLLPAPAASGASGMGASVVFWTDGSFSLTALPSGTSLTSSSSLSFGATFITAS